MCLLVTLVVKVRCILHELLMELPHALNLSDDFLLFFRIERLDESLHQSLFTIYYVSRLHVLVEL